MSDHDAHTWHDFGPIEAREFSGCRYRMRKRRAHRPDPITPGKHSWPPSDQVPSAPVASESAMSEQSSLQPPTTTSLGVRDEFEHRRVSRLLPTDGAVFKTVGSTKAIPITRIDCGVSDQENGTNEALSDDEAEFATLEALVSGVRIIENPVITTQVDRGPTIISRPDLLVRVDSSFEPHEAKYVPIMINMNVSVKPPQPNKDQSIRSIPISRLGVSMPISQPGRAKRQGSGFVALMAAHYFLEDCGIDSSMIGAIGTDSDEVIVWDPTTMQANYEDIVNLPIPTKPLRLKECQTCQFEQECHRELVALDDVSLVVPGNRGENLRESGITTVEELIDSHAGDYSALAYAWKKNWPLVFKPGVKKINVPRAEVEIDIDMEAYMKSGCYLWGTWHEGTYLPFATWGQLGGEDEAENFAEFWAWLKAKRDQAYKQGKSFAAYCYGSQGENYWLKSSARKFGGLKTAKGIVPSMTEIQEFINSTEWVDVYDSVRNALLGPEGLGLKTLAPLAGFHWEDEEMNGEESIGVFVKARESLIEEEVDSRQQSEARELLLRYNRDDCLATRRVRDWLCSEASAEIPRVPADL